MVENNNEPPTPPKTIRGYIAVHSTNSSIIVTPNVKDFFIHPTIINVIQNSRPCRGVVVEDANAHLDMFLSICNSINKGGHTKDYL